MAINKNRNSFWQFYMQTRGDQISGFGLANTKVFPYQVNPLLSHAWCGEK